MRDDRRFATAKRLSGTGSWHKTLRKTSQRKGKTIGRRSGGDVDEGEWRMKLTENERNRERDSEAMRTRDEGEGMEKKRTEDAEIRDRTMTF